MVRGICVNCGKSVGGFMQPAGLICKTQGCQNSGKVYCFGCAPKHKALLSAPKAVCPQCGRTMNR